MRFSSTTPKNSPKGKKPITQPIKHTQSDMEATPK